MNHLHPLSEILLTDFAKNNTKHNARNGISRARSGYSIPGIVLGIILGKIGEQNFAQGMQMVHYDLVTYFSRPICLILIVAGALTLLAGIYKAVGSSRSAASQ